MNLVLVVDEDFVEPSRVRLTGRRLTHIREVHRAAAGDELAVGRLGGRVGTGRVVRAEADAVELEVSFDADPPAKLELTLLLALPRPKVLNRVIAAAASLGLPRLFLINAWRVEKSYWKSLRLAEENLRFQAIIGLEQARDTVLPVIEQRRLFRPFVEDELPALTAGSTALVAHPYARTECPRAPGGPLALAIGPEGGFIPEEVASFERAGFRAVSMGPRILRVETVMAALVARLT